jgi:tRNA(fMet)-specific endonuclease VapC
MTFILDTDVSVDYLHGQREAVEFIESQNEVLVTIFTVAELCYGLENSTQRDRHAKALEKFLEGVYIASFNLESARKFGEIKAYLQKTGRQTGDFDTAIASICLTHKATLVTRNKRHYKNISHLKTHTP